MKRIVPPNSWPRFGKLWAQLAGNLTGETIAPGPTNLRSVAPGSLSHLRLSHERRRPIPVKFRPRRGTHKSTKRCPWPPLCRPERTQGPACKLPCCHIRMIGWGRQRVLRLCTLQSCSSRLRKLEVAECKAELCTVPVPDSRLRPSQPHARSGCRLTPGSRKLEGQLED